LLALIIVISINSEITFAQEKNETSEIDDSPLITNENCLLRKYNYYTIYHKKINEFEFLPNYFIFFHYN
jgi:hypothetical protein